jgi:hypothetical protein
MNELVMEMLEERRWGHVHLHGGVPSRQRSQLVSRLREDKHCQAFLSTDAGGVGLNLQTASTVINMDLPWNPAVLEQRIARVHRLGQKNAVRVVNFIAEDTIEHGMLSILSFKRSMFAGVIDGSTDKVMMGDSALNRFMKTIESATSATPSRPPTVPAPEPEDSAAAPISAPAKPGDGGATTRVLHTASLNIEMLGGLFVQGASLLQTFGRALQTGGDPPGPGNEWVRNWVTNNSATGKPEIRIPLPDQGVLEELGKKLLHAIAGIPPT